MRKHWTVVILAGTILTAATTSTAQDAANMAAVIKAFNKRLAEQDRKIAELEKKRAQQKKQQRATFLDLMKEMKLDTLRRPNDLRVYWKNGIRMATVDGRFKLKLGGRLMYDFGWISGRQLERDLGGNLLDGSELRRGRLYVAGSFYKHTQFKLQFDFAGGDADLKDAYLRFKKIPFVGNITIGHFKEPFSLEELTSSKYITFMERALPNALSIGRNAGIMANNAILGERVTWAVGLFNEVNDYGNGSSDGGYSFTARTTALPWYENKGEKLLHLGASYSFRSPKGNTRYRERPEAHFVGMRFTDTGSFVADHVNLFAAETAVVYGPFSAQAEYIGAVVQTENSSLGNMNLNGGYAQVSYFLTGEHRNYKKSAGAFARVKPKKNFRQDGGWGAWEVAARYSYLDLDRSVLPVTARAVQDATVGLNWYLNPNTRLMWNYVRSSVSGRDTSGDANIFMMRVQVDF